MRLVWHPPVKGGWEVVFRGSADKDGLVVTLSEDGRGSIFPSYVFSQQVKDWIAENAPDAYPRLVRDEYDAPIGRIFFFQKQQAVAFMRAFGVDGAIK